MRRHDNLDLLAAAVMCCCYRGECSSDLDVKKRKKSNSSNNGDCNELKGNARHEQDAFNISYFGCDVDLLFVVVARALLAKRVI